MVGDLSVVRLGVGFASKSGIAEYVSYVNSVPVLSTEEERQLLKSFAAGDQQSGKKVAEAHLRIVVKIALEFKSYYNNLWDIIAEGNIGLLRALQNFSVAKDVRFSTYAMLWIKSAIQEFILKSSSMLKINIGSMQKKIMFNLHKVKRALNRYNRAECTTAQIAEILQVPESEVINISGAISSRELSLDSEIADESSATIHDIIPAEIPSPEQVHFANDNIARASKTVNKALSCLTDREHEIIKKRFLSDKTATLAELASKFGISVERVRQIETSALQKMRKAARLAN